MSLKNKNKKKRKIKITFKIFAWTFSFAFHMNRMNTKVKKIGILEKVDDAAISSESGTFSVKALARESSSELVSEVTGKKI